MIKKLIGSFVNVVLIIIIILSTMYLTSSIQAWGNPGQIPSVLGLMPLTVVSGSMSPQIETGDMVIVKKQSEPLEAGDVITYRMGGVLVTHRIVSVTKRSGQAAYETRGDANNTSDGRLVNADQIVGKYMFRIPGAGYVKTFLKGMTGILFGGSLILVLAMTAVLKQTTMQVQKMEQINNHYSKVSLNI